MLKYIVKHYDDSMEEASECDTIEEVINLISEHAAGHGHNADEYDVYVRCEVETRIKVIRPRLD